MQTFPDKLVPGAHEVHVLGPEQAAQLGEHGVHILVFVFGQKPASHVLTQFEPCKNKGEVQPVLELDFTQTRFRVSMSQPTGHLPT